MNECATIPTGHPHLLAEPTEKGELAREELFFDMLPYVIGLQEGAEAFGEAALNAAAAAVVHFRRRTEISAYVVQEVKLLHEIIQTYTDRFEGSRLAAGGDDDLHDASPAFRSLEERRRRRPSNYGPIEISGEEADSRLFVRSFCSLTRQLHNLKSAEDGALPEVLLQRIQQGAGGHIGFDRRKLPLTKDFILQVDAVLSRGGEVDFYANTEAPDLKRAKDTVNMYAPVAPILYALGDQDLTADSAATDFSKQFPQFAAHYSDMYQILTSTFNAPRERYFRPGSIYTVEVPDYPDEPRLPRHYSNRLIAAIAEALPSRSR